MPLAASPVVVVEVPARDRARPEAAALIAACTSALDGGRCQLARTDAEVESGTAIAIVSFRDVDHLRALVEVASSKQPNETWLSEELEFKSQDQRLERFRTLGLAIAALVREASREMPGGASGSSGAAAEADGARSPKARDEAVEVRETTKLRDAAKETAVSAPSSPQRRAEAWISAGPSAFYDPKLSSWRYGGQLHLGLGGSAFPGFVSLSGSYESGTDNAGVSLSWGTLGLGAGLRGALSRNFELRAIARGLMVNLEGRASDPARTDRASVWVPGGGLGSELRLRESDRWSATLGVEVLRMAGNVPIREHDVTGRTVGKTSFGVTLSLEFRLWVPSNTRK